MIKVLEKDNARYTAFQWTGHNVAELRQFIKKTKINIKPCAAIKNPNDISNNRRKRNFKKKYKRIDVRKKYKDLHLIIIPKDTSKHRKCRIGDYILVDDSGWKIVRQSYCERVYQDITYIANLL